MKRRGFNLFLPSEIKHEYNHIKVGDNYIATYVVSTINNDVNFLTTLNHIYKFKNIQVIWDIEKLDSSEYIKKISQMYLVLKSEKSQNKFNLDNEFYNVFEKQVLKIREAVQVKNEDVYNIKIYLKFSRTDLKEMLDFSKHIQNSLYTQGIIIKPLNFRQLDAHLFSLFPDSRNKFIQKYLSNTVTTSALVTLFPYFNQNIIDNEGIIFGKVNNSICILDMFSPKYNNRNMCVFGSSGAGKSYFIKTNIIRNMCRGITQIIIDIEGEYGKLVKALGGQVLSAGNINILEFSEEYFLKCKEQELDVINEKCKGIYDILNYNNEKGYSKFKSKLYKVYNKFEIAKEKLYKNYATEDEICINKSFIKYFPCIDNLVYELNKSPEFSNVVATLESVNKHLCKDKNKCSLGLSDTIVIDFSKLNESEFEIFMLMWLMKIEEDLVQNTLIYIDEIWKVLQCGHSVRVSKKIIEMYKTIRKKEAGIIGISQDITDIALYANGEFAKSILNNSYFKVFFRFDYTENEELEKLGIVGKSLIKKIKLLDRGKAIMSIGGNTFDLEVFASEYEHSLIMEEK